eukprot:3503328-Heterocapsa_arctica.AAC.1
MGPFEVGADDSRDEPVCNDWWTPTDSSDEAAMEAQQQESLSPPQVLSIDEPSEEQVPKDWWTPTPTSEEPTAGEQDEAGPSGAKA